MTACFSSVTSMLHKLSWPTLQGQQIFTQALNNCQIRLALYFIDTLYINQAVYIIIIYFVEDGGMRSQNEMDV